MSADFKRHQPDEVNKRIEKKDQVVILDVREPEEWASGHIPNATHIPLGEIPNRLNELDKSKETIVVCRSGNRSGRACEYLSQLGYNVVNMEGGMLKWTGKVELD